MRNPKETSLHFVGIGGIGMSGIAQVFFNQGFKVTGSDSSESETTRRLEKIGIRIAHAHSAQNVVGADVVVISSAVKQNNPEVVEAKKLRIPVIPRAEMLGELMRGKTGIAVAGTHGKTTTTSMLATLLTSARLDPTMVIGGRVDSLGGNAKLGQGQYVVAEADESDGSFHHLPATFAIVTNIDNDHLDFFGNLEALDRAFADFVGKIPFYGLVAVCGDDLGVRRCLDRFTKPYVTYGMNADSDYYADQVELSGMGSSFRVFERQNGKHYELGTVTLQVPGKHNILNALGSVAMGRALSLSFSAIAEGLGAFRGVGRRFEVKWQDASKRKMIVDDYGHHPTEILATLKAARAFWPGRITCVFQPHRYSRTALCRDGFLSAFRDADQVLVTEIYAAGEESIPGVTGESLAQAISEAAPKTCKVLFVPTLDDALKTVSADFQEGDLVFCMGAGSITRLPEMLIRSQVQG